MRALLPPHVAALMKVADDLNTLALTYAAEVPIFLILPTSPESATLYSSIKTPGGARGDSGVDLRFPDLVVVQPTSITDGLPHVIDLKVKVRCMRGPRFLPYMITPRSSICKTPLSLANSIGVVDQGYTGNLKVAVRNHSKDPFAILPGTSLFQLVLPSLTPARVGISVPDEPIWGDTVRGEGGFGSTGSGGASGGSAPGSGTGSATMGSVASVFSADGTPAPRVTDLGGSISIGGVESTIGAPRAPVSDGRGAISTEDGGWGFPSALM
jgi:dUTP pyrophosphatase